MKSAENKADRLTRVPKTWLERQDDDVCCVAAIEEDERIIMLRGMHRKHHLGINRTHFLANQQCPEMEFMAE